MYFLILRMSSIGDVILTLPAVSALRKKYSDARITWIAERQCAEILRGSALIDQLIEVDTRAWRNGWMQASGIRLVRDELRSIREIRPDVAIDFQGLLKSAMIARISGAPRRIGFTAENLREPASRFLYTETVSVDPALHVAERNIRLLEPLGIAPPRQYEFPIPADLESERWADERVNGFANGGFAILNPGGGWSTKLWDPARFGQIADWVWEQFGYNSVVTFGPGEEHLADEVLAHARAGSAIKLRTTLKQFAALTQRAALFLGSDTGPMHLAAARGTPVVGLYGPTQPSLNGPLDPRTETVARDVPCRVDCYRRSCDRWICMDIPAEPVQIAIAKRLEAEKNPR